MPRIRVEWLSIRTDEQRQALADRITQAFVEVAKVQPDQVNIVFEEIDPKHQAKGGIFWSERLKNKD